MHCRSPQECRILVKEAAVLATGSITEAALEKRLLKVEEMIEHRRLLMLQQIAVTFVTHEAEALREAEEDRMVRGN